MLTLPTHDGFPSWRRLGYAKVEVNIMNNVTGLIVRVCRAWRNPSPGGGLNREWHYEYAYDFEDVEKLKEKWYDVEVIGRIVDEKIFERGGLTRTTYYIYKCENNETYVEKVRVESGGAWNLIVKSEVPFEEINDFNEAAEAWKKAFLKEYPANCPFLMP